MNPRQLIIAVGVFCLAAPMVIAAPEGISIAAWRAAGLAAVMALWWFTDALPLAATALLPLAVAPLVGIAELSDVTASYSHPLIILFLGGFLLAKAIERWDLHQRLAFRILGFAGKSPGRILAAIMVTTAFLSLWISNTASAMVVAPIAAAIAGSQKDRPGFATALMLGVAYAATIGGMGTLIGTPPNAIFAAYVSDAYGIEVSFARWAALGLPAVVILLSVTWLVLARLTPGIGRDMLSTGFARDLGPMGAGERRVAIVAGLTALAWISRAFLEGLFPAISLSDAGIAMIAAIALFLLPSGEGGRLLDWDDAATLRWDVLILFGGGLALAGILEQTGLASWIGAQTELFRGLPTTALILVIAAVVVYTGELASNTAMASIFLPVAGAAAVALNVDPFSFVLPVAVAASIGFMLPVATPPNAIVFSHPSVTRKDMLRAGAPLDLVGIFIAVGICLVLGPYVFG